MNHHIGVLTRGHSPLRERVKGCEWPSLPPEIKHTLDVALMTPGFTSVWWARALSRDEKWLARYRKALSHDLIPDAIENYNSITREDAIALAQFPGHKPVRSTIQMVEDIRAGMGWSEARKTYKCSEQQVANMLKYPLLSHPYFPDWFRAQIPGA